MAKQRKRPLPGYRFIFMTFGIVMIVCALWMVVEWATGKKVPEKSEAWFFAGFTALWLVVGGIYIWFSLTLKNAVLTKKHWKVGWLIIPLGIVSGIGIPIGFMLLIWNDDDVKAHFKHAPPLAESDS